MKMRITKVAKPQDSPGECPEGAVDQSSIDYYLVSVRV